MPLTPKGEEIEKAMTAEYGPKKGEQVLYASENKGTISGIHDADAPEYEYKQVGPPGQTLADIQKANEKLWRQYAAERQVTKP